MAERFFPSALIEEEEETAAAVGPVTLVRGALAGLDCMAAVSGFRLGTACMADAEDAEIVSDNLLLFVDEIVAVVALSMDDIDRRRFKLDDAGFA